MIVIPTASATQILKVLLGVLPAEDWALKLYVNNHTPSAATVIGDLTEGSAGGYVALEIAKGNGAGGLGGWASIAAGLADAGIKEFPFTGACGPWYGYYYEGVTSGELYAVERFGAAITIDEAGERIRIDTAKLYAGTLVV